MKSIIKVFGLLVLVGVFFSSINMVNAESYQPVKVVSFEDLDTLPIEEAYTYEEILRDMQNDGLVSKETIKSFKESHKSNLMTVSSSKSTILYSKIGLNPYEFSTVLYRYSLQPEFVIGLEYRRPGSPSRIVSLEQPYLYTGKGRKCSFNGTIFYKLEAGNSIYSSVSGKVYKSGGLNVSGGIRVGLGQSATANLKISKSSGFIKDVSFQRRYYSAGLEK